MSLALGLIEFYAFACPVLGIRLSMNLGTNWRVTEAVLFLRVASNISSSDNGKYNKNGEKGRGYFFATMGVLRKPMFSTQASMTSPGFKKLSGLVLPSASLGLVSNAVPEQVPAQIMSPG